MRRRDGHGHSARRRSSERQRHQEEEAAERQAWAVGDRGKGGALAASAARPDAGRKSWACALAWAEASTDRKIREWACTGGREAGLLNREKKQADIRLWAE